MLGPELLANALFLNLIAKKHTSYVEWLVSYHNFCQMPLAGWIDMVSLMFFSVFHLKMSILDILLYHMFVHDCRGR